MVNEKAYAQGYRAAVIKSINNLKAEAIRLGFDFPTDFKPENSTADINELVHFQAEMLEYIYEHLEFESILFNPEAMPQDVDRALFH
jgi:hypothetical protein